MPSNLKEVINKQSRNSSMMQQEAQMELGLRTVGKFTMSRNECVDQLTSRLMQLSRREQDLRLYSQNGTTEVLRKFQEDYSVLSKQIIRYVEGHLRQTKQRIIRDIKERRNIQMIELRPIKKNIDRLRQELTSLREGLHRDNQYREYISRVVKKDFEAEIQSIKIDIKKLRFPSVHLSINQQHYSCFKNDLDRLIVTDDQLFKTEYSKPKIPNYSGQGDSSNLNLHANRDHIKKNNLDSYNR